MTDRVYHNQGNQPVVEQVVGKNLEILDIGCGAGDNAIILHHRGYVIDGITYSEPEAELCRKIMRNVYVHDLNTGLPPDLTSTYDFILCSHILEHLPYPELLLKDLKLFLKKDGKIIVALPNLMHYKSRLKLLRGDFEYEETGIWDNTHLRWYTFVTGKKLLEKSGFVVTKSWVEGDMPALRLFKILPIKIRKMIFLGLSSISKGLFGSQLLYVAQLKQLE